MYDPRGALAVVERRPRKLDGKALSVALAARLSPVVPPGIVVRASGRDVVVRTRSLWSATDVCRILASGPDQRLQLEWACYAVLDHVQDVVIGELRRGWPSSRPGWLDWWESGSLLPLPDVRVQSGKVFLWFGQEHAPALALEPLTAREILEPR